MINYINKNTGAQYVCLSTDKKDIDVPNGAILYEMDTSTFYLFNKEAKTWEPQAIGSGGGGGGGTTDHTKLTAASRAKPDQHPIGAITGLEAELGSKAKATILKEW